MVLAAVIAGLTLVLVIVSIALHRARLRWGPSAVQPPGFEPVIAPAAWEKEGGRDLTAPAPDAVLLQPPAGLQLPDGAKLRAAGASASSADAALINDVVSGLEQIPPLPRAVQQILKELDAAGSSAKSVSAIVATEPVLSAALLRLGNSAAVGLRRKIVTVDEAVSYLGFSTVRALVLRLKLGALLAGGSPIGIGTLGRGYDVERLWMHSLAVGAVAEHIAARAGGADPGLAGTVGLLHDIGKLAINSQFPIAVMRLWDPPPPGSADESFLARERRLFGADHAFVGGYLAAKWQLPEELVEAIRLHHSPTDAAAHALRPELRRALLAVHVANQLVKYASVYCADMEIDILPSELLAELNLPRDIEQVVDAGVRTVITRATAVAESGAAAHDEPPKPLAAAG
jgi:putative nucleotidyltransferase with HDIG domain